MPTGRQSVRRVGPAAEALLALLGGVLIAVLTRRPQDLAATVAGADARDPVLVSWILAWPAHALRSGRSVWDANIFAPTANSLAFSDSLLGYVPFGLIGDGPAAAIVRYNVVQLFALALAFAGVWVLVRQLGLGRTAALVAAVAFAVNPWRVSQLNHLQVLSSGGIPLALAMLARGHGVGRRTGGPVRPGWAVAGWATAAWHMSIGPGLGLQLAYVLALCTAVAAARALLAAQRGRGWPASRLLLADGVGLVLFLAVGGALALPYLQAVEDQPQARRSVAELTFYSPTPAALITAPPDSWLWGEPSQDRRAGVVAVNEKELFPGLLVTVLAGAGLALAGPWSRRRTVLLAGAVVVLVLCALGTAGPAGGRWSYLLVYEHLPGYQGVRTPSRLVTTAWLGLALLAAHGVAVLTRLLPAPAVAARLALAVGLTAVVLLEGVDTAPASPVRPVPGLRLAELPGLVMVLPSEDSVDQDVMRWSTDGFPRVVNGVSGFTPTDQARLRLAASRLPAPEAVEELRASGVRTLVLLSGLVPRSRYQGADPASLARLPGVTVEQRGDVAVVRI